MSKISEAIASLRELFNQYAKEDVLTKHDLVEMLHSEVPGTEDMSQAEVKDFFDQLDEDGDGEVDFKEFVNFAVTLQVLYDSI